jgi:L-malate glycosyltransferase
VVLATPAESELRRRAAAAGVSLHNASAASDLDILGALRFRRVIRETAPDIVHAHDARSHALALLALPRLRTPLVVTRRVTFAPRAGIKYGTRVAHFIAISNAVRNGLLAGGVDSARVTVVYSAVPPLTASAPIDWRGRCRWPNDAVVCGIVGAMTREKGLQQIEAIARALPPTVAERTRLILIGGGAEPAAIRVGSLEGFRAGFIADIENAIAGLDLLWHPATSEGLGTVLLEAMALKVPPLAYATGGIPEIVEDGISGVLVPTGDTAAFANASARLISDAAARSTLAAAGPRRSAQFSTQRMIAETTRVYYKVISSWGRGFSRVPVPRERT